jgi:hypothetical protein
MRDVIRYSEAFKGNNDSGGECGERTCAYADIMPSVYSVCEDSAIFEREAIAAE